MDTTVPTTQYTLSNGVVIFLKDYLTQSDQERLQLILQGSEKFQISLKEAKDEKSLDDKVMEFTLSDSFAYNRARIEAYLAGGITYEQYDVAHPKIRQEITDLINEIDSKKK